MKRYLHRILMGLVAVMTLGVITPNHEIWANLQQKENSEKTDHTIQDAHYSLEDYYLPPSNQPSIEETLIASARERSYEKFGTRIRPFIQDEFDTVIFPKIEEVIQMTLQSSQDHHPMRFAITETPSGNYAEKIFHVHDMEQQKDLIRFHVRTEKRPLEGYYYNFHYHTWEDRFTGHHVLGEIFWSKNTPPKWLS